MADPAHAATDEILNRLERRLKREYTQAAREVQKKLDDYLAAFKIKDAEWQRRVADGKATKTEYKNWRTGQMMMGRRWGQLQQECAENLANANQIAHTIAYGYQSEVYALNHNFATYEVEHSGKLDTAYTLYDKDTVARLMRDDPDMLPPPGKTVKERIAQGKDVLWNKQQLQSVMMQAIVQGESIDKIAKRMSEAVATSDYKAAVRYARTMTTNTQNAGRYEGYRRAKGMGVDLTIEWSATLDNRTRHDHRLLHGQRRDVDEPFEVDNIKILYPAQLGVGSSDIPQSMIWNCRCTLLAWVKGFEGETVKSSPKMGDMSFEEWQEMKEDDPRYKAERYKKGDQEQYADYKKLLGKNAPKSFGEFQQVKYNDAEKYADWKKQAAEKRNAKDKKRGQKPLLSKEDAAQQSIAHTLERIHEEDQVQKGLHVVASGDIKWSERVQITAKVDAEMQTAFAGALDKMSHKYESTLFTVRTATKEEAMYNGTKFAWCAPNMETMTTEMVINPVSSGNHDILLERMKKARKLHHFVNVPDEQLLQYIPTHEFAHTILSTNKKLDENRNWTKADYKKIAAARKEINQAYEDYLSAVKKVKSERDNLGMRYINGDFSVAEEARRAEKAYKDIFLSNYSMENADEFLAESVAYVELVGGENQYAKRVSQILLKYFGKGK